MPKLVIHLPDGPREHPLTGEPVTVGRSSSNTIPLRDERASREHARFEPAEGTWYVVDLGSSNGTYVDGRKVDRQELTHGAVVKIGNTRFSFVDESAPIPPVPKPVSVDLSLRAHGGPLDGQEFTVTKEVTRIGRAPDNDIVIDDRAVSKHHAELILLGDRARIEDRGSRNGVTVNGARVTTRDLDPGDQIRIGPVTFEFLGPAAGVAPAGAAPAAEKEEEKPEEPKTGLAAVFTPRVKILAAAVAVIFLLGLLVNTLGPSAPEPEEFPDNLLTENPSFEKGGGTDIPGWGISGAQSGLEQDGVQDGARALRLVAAGGAGSDIAAVCRSAPVAVAPGKLYELSALVKNSGSEAVALCATWQNSGSPWLVSSELGPQIEDATAWRRVSKTFRPPSWADRGRFGAVVIGQGVGWLDGFRLRKAGNAPPPRQVAASRLAIEAGNLGEFTVFADGQPMFGRGRALVTTGGQPFRQSYGTLDQPVRAAPRMIEVVGRIGLGAKVPFTQALSSDGSRLRLHYEVTLADARDATVALEMLSGAKLLGGGVLLGTTGGGTTTESGPFENRPRVQTITFFSGKRRVFLELSVPASVSATRGKGEAVVWRLDFPARTGGANFAVSLVWSCCDNDTAAAVAAELQRGADAEKDERLGKAMNIYQAFTRRYPLYAKEQAVVAERLRRVRAAIARQVAQVERLRQAARISGADDDFRRAERACDQALAKLAGNAPAVRRVRKILAELKVERKAAERKRRDRQAADMLEKARNHIRNKEFTIARVLLETLAKKYPETAHAKTARDLLKTLPRPD